MGKQFTIMVVEDSPTQAMKLLMLLKKHSYATLQAENGKKALKILQTENPSLIISDVVMPEMDGFELCRVVKADPILNSIPVILLTTLSGPNDIVKGLKVKADYYVTKPYDSDFLTNKIAEILIGKSGVVQKGKKGKLEMVVDSKKHSITATRAQLLTLLLSVYENAVLQNQELAKTRDQLSSANQGLAENLNKLAVSEERFRSLVQTVPDVVYRLNPDGSFAFINEAISKLGYNAEELIGKHFSDIIYPADIESVSRQFVLPKLAGKSTGDESAPKLFDERRSGDRKTSGLEVRLRYKDEEGYKPGIIETLSEDMLYAEVSSAGMHQADMLSGANVLIGTVGVIRDITIRKKMEKKLRASYDELENKVAQRTANLAHANSALEAEIIERKSIEQQLKEALKKMKTTQAESEKMEAKLRQSQKMEALGTLAGGIAHDFNNILSGILGYARLAYDDNNCPDQTKRNIGGIIKASKRATELVKHILSFSRQYESDKKQLLIDIVTKEVVKLLRATLPSTINIYYEADSDDYMVFADPTELHQVLMNLCTNAAHAMDEQESGELLISLKRQKIDNKNKAKMLDVEPGDYIVLAVVDNGHGIPEEIKENIFEPFFTTKKKDVGTGLGLSVVHGIVKANKGAISVYSEPNKGTKFKVYLPAITREINLKNEENRVEVRGGKEYILVVDDEVALTDILKQSLERLGYKTTCSVSSVEALKLFEKSSDAFDLVITDYAMPDMNGLNLAEKIISIRQNIPIIMCTGYSERINQNKMSVSGITKLLIKPVLQEDLAFAIREVLDKNAKLPDLSQSIADVTLLMVDDEPLILSAVRRILKGSNVNLLQANSGEEALKLFNENRNRIDVVITDLGMPGMGGRKAALTIREISPNLPIYISSGHGKEDPEYKAIKDVTQGYLEKPYGKNELKKCLRLTSKAKMLK